MLRAIVAVPGRVGGLGYVSLLVVCVRQFDDHESDQRSGVGGDGLVGCSEGIFQT